MVCMWIQMYWPQWCGEHKDIATNMQWHVHITASRFFFFWRRTRFSLSPIKMYVGFSFFFAPPKLGEKMLSSKFAYTSKAETSSWVYFSCSCDCRNIPEKYWGQFIPPTALSSFTYIQNCPFPSNFIRHFIEGYWPRLVSFTFVWNSRLFYAKWINRKVKS